MISFVIHEGLRGLEIHGSVKVSLFKCFIEERSGVETISGIVLRTEVSC